MALTADFLQNSIVLALIGYAIAFGFQVYMMWLNIKQSRVNNQMAELLEEVKLIRQELNASKKRASSSSKTTVSKKTKKKVSKK